MIEKQAGPKDGDYAWKILRFLVRHREARRDENDENASCPTSSLMSHVLHFRRWRAGVAGVVGQILVPIEIPYPKLAT